MQRNDWLWLAVKVAALYLVVLGVENLPAALDAMFGNESQWSMSLASPFLQAAVPLGAGILAYAKSDQIVGRTAGVQQVPAATATGPGAAPASMRREDWLWLLFKVLGLWALTSVISLAIQLLVIWRAAALISGGLLALVLFGLSGVLLFTDHVWLWACRHASLTQPSGDAAAEPPPPPSRPRIRAPRDRVGMAILTFYLVVVLGGIGGIVYLAISSRLD